MKICLILSIALFFFVHGEVISAEENQPVKQPASQLASPKKEIPSDLDSIKDPFVPKLPLEPKMKPQSNQQNLNESSMNISPPVSPVPPQSVSLAPAVEIRPPLITISGLVWNTDRPQAIVNNEIVGIGDKINEWSIVAISEEGIEISYLDKRVLVSNQFDK